MKKLARISKASLEIKERGIFNFWIHVNYEEGCCQGIGGIALDEPKHVGTSDFKRVGTAFGCEVIRRLLVELDVNDFSEMVNKHIWVIGEGEGFSFKPIGVGALLVDNRESSPVIFNDVLKEFTESSEGE